MQPVFNARRETNAHVQREVGMHSPNCEIPRHGDRTREGLSGYDRVSCNSHATPFSRDTARAIWAAVDPTFKNHPVDAFQARSLIHLAQVADRPIPEGCATAVGNDVPPLPVTYYNHPGGPIILGKHIANRFITFIYRNMDNGHRVKWYNLTGREQWEWYEAFLRCGETHVRNEAETHGLRGTDLGRITTVAQLHQAGQRSPGSVRQRPANHPIAQQAWDVARNLFPAN